MLEDHTMSMRIWISLWELGLVLLLVVLGMIGLLTWTGLFLALAGLSRSN